MFYLIDQMLLSLLLASLFGLAVGWLLWGRLAKRLRSEIESLSRELAELRRLPAVLAEARADHAAAQAAKDAEVARLLAENATVLMAQIRDLDPLRDQLAALRAEANHVTAEKEANTLEYSLRLRDLEAQLQARDADLAGHLAAHETETSGHALALAERDHRIAQLEARVGELEPQAAQLASKDSRVAWLASQIDAWSRRLDATFRDTPKAAVASVTAPPAQ